METGMAALGIGAAAASPLEQRTLSCSSCVGASGRDGLGPLAALTTIAPKNQRRRIGDGG